MQKFRENQVPKRQPQRPDNNSFREPSVTREIVLPIDCETYQRAVADNQRFRALLDEHHRQHPECFPPEFGEEGFRFKDFKESKKMNMRIRRITVGLGDPRHWRVLPCDVLPYMAGHTGEVEKPLLLRKFNVPYWALEHVFGRNANYFYRVERRMGMASIAGSLAGAVAAEGGDEPAPETAGPNCALPEDIVCDEKHAKYVGEKAYVAMTAGGGCVLGAELCAGADKESLCEGYGVLKAEIERAAPDHGIKSINTDGFSSTTAALRAVYGVGVVFITCILHLYIALRDGCKRKHRLEFETAATGLWWCYEAETKRSFAQRWRSLMKWCTDNASWLPERLVGKLTRANERKLPSYKAWYDRPQGHRVSVGMDRLMGLLDRRLFAMRHLHGHFVNSRLLIRAWAHIYNFAPWNPHTAKINGARCPAEKLTGMRYRENWLENFRVASSMGGYRHPPKTA
jgi:hypothetical protein